MDIIGKAKFTLETLESLYEEHKLKKNCTLWGVAYYWDSSSNSFSDPIEPINEELIPYIFDQALGQGKKIITPDLFVPKSHDQSLHYSLLSIRNRSIVVEGVSDLVGDQHTDLITDSRLANEAATRYYNLRLDGQLEAVDFFKFLRDYNEEGLTLGEGDYSSLLERLMIQHEGSKSLFPKFKHLVNDFERLTLNHHAAIKEDQIEVDADLLDANDRYSPSNINGDIGDDDCPFVPRLIMGKRRQRVGAGSGGGYIDWSTYANRMDNRSRINFDPNILLNQTLVDKIVIDNTESFRKDPIKTLNDLKNKSETVDSNAEQKALNTAIQLLEYASCFDSNDRINHKMTIRYHDK